MITRQILKHKICQTGIISVRLFKKQRSGSSPPPGRSLVTVASAYSPEVDVDDIIDGLVPHLNGSVGTERDHLSFIFSQSSYAGGTGKDHNRT